MMLLLLPDITVKNDAGERITTKGYAFYIEYDTVFAHFCSVSLNRNRCYEMVFSCIVPFF